MTKKKSRSFSIPEDLDDLMRERSDVNWSGLVSNFLQEYAASGKGTEAALAVRLEQVESELSDARQEVERLERERERIESALDEKRKDRRDVYESFESLDIRTDNLTSSNPAVKNHAEKLGMHPETFLKKYRDWKS
jgi:chromosome segregation ATPase